MTMRNATRREAAMKPVVINPTFLQTDPKKQGDWQIRWVTIATFVPVFFGMFLIGMLLWMLASESHPPDGSSSYMKATLFFGTMSMSCITLTLVPVMSVLRHLKGRIEELEKKVEAMSKAEPPPGMPRVADECGTRSSATPPNRHSLT